MREGRGRVREVGWGEREEGRGCGEREGRGGVREVGVG